MKFLWRWLAWLLEQGVSMSGASGSTSRQIISRLRMMEEGSSQMQHWPGSWELRVSPAMHSPCFDTLKGTSWEMKLAMKQHEESKQSEINWYLYNYHCDFWTYLIEAHLEIDKKTCLIFWKFQITTIIEINMYLTCNFPNLSFVKKASYWKEQIIALKLHW